LTTKIVKVEVAHQKEIWTKAYWRALHQGGVLQNAFLQKKDISFLSHLPTLSGTFASIAKQTYQRAAESTITTFNNDLVSHSDPIWAWWCDSNGISLEEGSLVAIEELTSFLRTMTMLNKTSTDKHEGSYLSMDSDT
jgi:hypothetical protein